MEGKRKLNNPLSALRHRNFALYAAGMCFSLIGTWMQNVAQPWLAYEITDSPFLLSLVTIMQFLPMLFFSLFSGVVIDRYSKKKLLFFTQSASLVITFVLAMLVWTGTVQYWHILVSSVFLGIVNTLDMPTRQSFVIEMVGKEDLLNAIALNSSIFNAARVLGPALAGLVMAEMGISACFFFNSISFAAVIISLFFIKPVEAARIRSADIKVWQSIKDGIIYIKNNPVVSKTLLSVFVVAAFGMNISVLLPVFAKVALAQGEAGYGYLMSIMGIGSLIGALVVASMSRGGPKNIILKCYPYFIALMNILIALTKSFLLSGVGLALLGFFYVSFAATSNSTIQYNTLDEYRGRVMSVYSLFNGGAMPIGNFYAGMLTENFGPTIGFLGCGSIIALLMGGSLLIKTKRKGSEKAQ